MERTFWQAWVLVFSMYRCEHWQWYRRWVGGVWHGYYRHPLPHTGDGEWQWYCAWPDGCVGKPPDVIEYWPPAPQARLLEKR
jgi:hypothetical protein